MKLRNLFMVLALLAMSWSVFAQTQLKVGTGGPTGTYHRIFAEFQQACKDQIMQIEVPSKGSVDNMDKLLDNSINAAIVQTDVLFYRARNEDLGGIKTLFSLYPEEIHVIAATVSPIQEGGTMGFGKKPIQVNNISDLAGRNVAAWGGSIITAQVIRLQSEISFNVAEVADFKSAKAALDSGQVAAIVMVGGQPMDDIKTLNNAYKLLPFPEAVMGKLKSVYVPAKLNYSGMGQGGSGVQSIATESLFVTRAYKTDKYVQSLAALRGCFKANLPTLQEETGFHKKWASVNYENQGKWSYYQLPETVVKIKK
jgi:TRAP-type uncharacterized transport system substrate-binding protein